MQNPFANVEAPPDPTDTADLLVSGDFSDPGPAQSAQEPRTAHPPTLTPIYFPVVLDVGGQMEPIAIEALAAPAERVASLVEAVQDALITPPAIAQLQALVAEASCLKVTDLATRKRASELYELLAQNEKGIELAIGPVVAFFHRPWNAMTKFRAKFAKPVDVAKKYLSDEAGAWDVTEERKAKELKRRQEDEAKREEQRRLQEMADTAKATGDVETAAVAEQMVQEVTAPALPMPAYKPKVTTKSRKSYVVLPEDVDEDAIYAAMAKDPLLRKAAPLDFGYLNRQAKDYGPDMAKRFPGIVAREKGGLSASGK